MGCRARQNGLLCCSEALLLLLSIVQVMAEGGRQVVLPMLSDTGLASASSIAVQVQRSASGSSWEVLLLPAVRVDNRLSTPVHICMSREVGNPTSSPGGTPGRTQQHEALEVPSGGSAELPLRGTSSVLRLWLGGDVANGTGWSQAVPLLPLNHQRQHRQGQQQDPVLMVLHSSAAAAATALAAGVRSPTTRWAASQQLGAVLAQVAPPDRATGQACIRIWPPLLLRNATPCPLRLVLPPMCPQQAQQGPPPAPQELLLPPGGSHQLTVPLHGGTVGALLSLEARGCGNRHAAAASEGSSGEAAQHRLPIVVPPLIAESPEQQWFGSGRAKDEAGSSDEAARAVLIAPPGEATWLRLPLVVARPSSTPTAAAPEGTASGGSGGALTTDCLLVTQQHADGLPLLQLSLQPALAVHNCLPVPLHFQVGFRGAQKRGRSWPGAPEHAICTMQASVGTHPSSSLPGAPSPSAPLHLPAVAMSCCDFTLAGCAGAGSTASGGACGLVVASSRRSQPRGRCG